MKPFNDMSDLLFTERRGRLIENSVSTTSQICHLLSFEIRRPKSTFDTAMLIFSIDIDVGSAQIGQLNYGANDSNVHNCFTEEFIGGVEQCALPIFVNAFDNFGIPATFALRGQITELGGSSIEPLLNAQVKHDIGAHGYSHKNFQTLSRNEAEVELSKIAIGLRRFGIQPKSFIFPRNFVGHLDLLEKFDYKCYRNRSEGWLADGLFVEKKNKLYNIQPSLYLNQSATPFILKKLLDVAIAKKAPLHLWFHLWTFGFKSSDTNKYVRNVFLPFLKYAQAKYKNGILTFETMVSAAKKAERSLTIG